LLLKWLVILYQGTVIVALFKSLAIDRFFFFFFFFFFFLIISRVLCWLLNDDGRSFWLEDEDLWWLGMTGWQSVMGFDFGLCVY
jgi:hypothetical protein